MVETSKEITRRIGWLANKVNGTQIKCSARKKMDSNKRSEITKAGLQNYRALGTQLLSISTTIMKI